MESTMYIVGYCSRGIGPKVIINHIPLRTIILSPISFLWKIGFSPMQVWLCDYRLRRHCHLSSLLLAVATTYSTFFVSFSSLISSLLFSSYLFSSLLSPPLFPFLLSLCCVKVRILCLFWIWSLLSRNELIHKSTIWFHFSPVLWVLTTGWAHLSLDFFGPFDLCFFQVNLFFFCLWNNTELSFL